MRIRATENQCKSKRLELRKPEVNTMHQESNVKSKCINSLQIDLRGHGAVVVIQSPQPTWDLQFKPQTLCGKVGSCLPMVSSLQYLHKTLTELFFQEIADGLEKKLPCDEIQIFCWPSLTKLLIFSLINSWSFFQKLSCWNGLRIWLLCDKNLCFRLLNLYSMPIDLAHFLISECWLLTLLLSFFT